MPNDIETIISMHRLKRPANSTTELEFIKEWIEPLGTKADRFGNRWVIVGPTDVKPDVLWSSHTDTVHKVAGTQKLLFDGTILKLHPKASSSCLGADCTAGVWVMREMILAKVPGLYVFHAEEEFGQYGADGFAKDNAAYLATFRAAIAFDRKGRDSVVTRMMGGLRTCSDAFADSVAKQISGYRKDEWGSVTDTFSYRKIIAECTNLSVGYVNAHIFQESLNVHDLIALRNAMLAFDASKLVVERDPKGKDDYRTTYYGSGGYWNPYPKGTHAHLIKDSMASTIGRALSSVMTYDEFKALVDKAKSEEDAEWDAKYGTDGRFAATDPDVVDADDQPTVTRKVHKAVSSTGSVALEDGWPDATGTSSLTGGVSTRALRQYGSGMFGTTSPIAQAPSNGNAVQSLHGRIKPAQPLPATASRHRSKARTRTRGTEKV